MKTLLPILYIVGLLGAFSIGVVFYRTHVRSQGSRPTNTAWYVAPVTSLLLVVLIVTATLQFFFPTMLTFVQRDADRFFHGEWWRLVTPFFFQDGGVGGTIFNLANLILVGPVAEKLWEKRQFVGIVILGGIVGEIAGMFWQPIGVGNSIGTFSLAGSVAVACLTRQANGVVKIISLLLVCVYALLFAFKDIHGAAAITGCLVAFVFSRLRINRPVGTQ